MNWLHYEARRIPRRPREVTISDEVEGQRAKYPAIDKIASEFRAGGDLTPWLHDPIRDRKADHAADMMFNDWQVNHLHLGDVLEKPGKMKRTGDLLFAYVTGARAILLDVKPHRAWADRDLLRILRRVSPQDMDRFRLKEIVAATETYTDAAIMNLRKNRITAMISLDGDTFMAPGMGISSSGHSTRFVRYADWLHRQIARLLEEIRYNALPVDVRVQLAQKPATLVRLGVRMEAGEVVLYDKNRNLELYRMQCVA